MKKFKRLLVIMLMLGMLSACSTSEESKGVSTVCSQTLFGMEIQYIAEAETEDGDLTSIKFILIASYDQLGVSLEALDDEAKEALVENLETSMGLQEGVVNVVSEFKEDALYLEADFDLDYLKATTVGETDMSYATFVSELESAGLTCE